MDQNKSLKINIVLPNHARIANGGYVIIFSYVNYLISKGHEVRLYYMMKEFLDSKRIPSLLRRLMASYMVNAFPKWFNLDERVQRFYLLNDDAEIKDADIIMATAVITADIVKKQKDSKGKKVYFIQDYETWMRDESYVQETYSYGMKNIVISNWLKELVDKYSNEESVCVKNGIDSGIFYDKKMERTNHSIVLHYRSAHYKGGDIALKVIERVAQKYSDLVVNVITSEGELPELPSCCIGKIRISQQEVSDINNASKIFLCTSRQEGYGLPGLEAMACGAAVVTTKYQGALEYAQNFDKTTHEGNAVLVESEDVDALVSAISDVFDNEADYISMINNGIETAKRMDKNIAAEKFESVLLHY